MDKEPTDRNILPTRIGGYCSKYYKHNHLNSLESSSGPFDSVSKNYAKNHVRDFLPKHQPNKYAYLISIVEAMQTNESQSLKISEQRLDELDDSVKKMIVEVESLERKTKEIKEENNLIMHDLLTAEQVISNSIKEVINLRKELLEVQPPSKLKSRNCPKKNESLILKSVGTVLNVPYFTRVLTSAYRLLPAKSSSPSTAKAAVFHNQSFETKKMEQIITDDSQ